MAAERALKPGGMLAVVTFHSLEDRIVKRFFQLRSGHEAQRQPLCPGHGRGHRRASTWSPARAVAPDEAELAENPRARSAKLRVGRRTAAARQARSTPPPWACRNFHKKGRR